MSRTHVEHPGSEVETSEAPVGSAILLRPSAVCCQAALSYSFLSVSRMPVLRRCTSQISALATNAQLWLVRKEKPDGAMVERGIGMV